MHPLQNCPSKAHQSRQEQEQKLAKEREDERQRLKEEQQRLAKEKQEEQQRLAKKREEQQQKLAKEREELLSPSGVTSIDELYVFPSAPISPNPNTIAQSFSTDFSLNIFMCSLSALSDNSRSSSLDVN